MHIPKTQSLAPSREASRNGMRFDAPFRRREARGRMRETILNRFYREDGSVLLYATAAD